MTNEKNISSGPMEPPKHPTRILIFHGDDARRARLCQLLDDGAAFTVVGQFAVPEEAPPLHDGASPDVVQLEFPQEDSNNDAIASLRRQYPDALVIAYSVLENTRDQQQMALPFVLPLPADDVEGLAQRVRASLESGQPLAEADLRTLLALFPDDRAGQRYGLSRREKQVLKCMVEGLSNKQIADVLRIGEDTVKKHLKHIYGKLEVSTGKMAVVKALRERLVS